MKIPPGCRVISTDQLATKYPELKHAGQIKFITTTKDDFMIFVFVFDNKIGCSSCCQADFQGVGFYDDCFTRSQIADKMKEVKSLAGWSFFCLNQPIPEESDLTYIFPIPDDENTRVISLKESIKKKYDIKEELNSTAVSINLFAGHTKGYCQFSGGGDLILMDGRQSLVIKSTTDMGQPSPNNSGDEILDEVIEAKSCTLITEKILYQLFGNMILGTVDSFLDRIKQNSYETKSEIFKVNRLIGYGMICTGASCFAFYKIIVDFNKEISIITKVAPSMRPFNAVAQHIDYCIEYFMSKL